MFAWLARRAQQSRIPVAPHEFRLVIVDPHYAVRIVKTDFSDLESVGLALAEMFPKGCPDTYREHLYIYEKDRESISAEKRNSLLDAHCEGN